MRQAGLWIWVFVAIWLFHLVVGIASWAAAFRIYESGGNRFVRWTMVHLHAAVIDAVGAVVMIFVARQVHFNWAFAITMFASALLRDIVRLPLLLYILRGPRSSHMKDDEKDKQPKQPSKPARPAQPPAQPAPTPTPTPAPSGPPIRPRDGGDPQGPGKGGGGGGG